MSCPPAIAEVLLEILGEGLLRTRAAAWAGETMQAACEADHLHNLPELLKDYSPDLLKDYWETTRPSFLAECNRLSISVEALDPLWLKLRERMAECSDQLLVK
jgi:hypothetical protein